MRGAACFDRRAPAAGSARLRRVNRLLVTVVLIAMLFGVVAPVAHASVAHAGHGHGEHTVLHLTLEAHEHADDGSFQTGGSVAAFQHVLADNLTSTALLADGRPAPSTALPATAPPHGRVSVLPSPLLDGLLRPPRAEA